MVRRTSAAMLLWMGLVGCADAEPLSAKPPVAVKVLNVEEGGTPAPTRLSGTLDAAARVDVAFRASGYVDEVIRGRGKKAKALDVGDKVKKGDVLARLRSADYAQRVATARARGLEASASSKLAEQEHERAKALFAAKVISRAELDARSAQRDSALAAVAGASAQIGEASLALGDTVLRAPMDGVILARRVEPGTLVSPGSVAYVIADLSTVKVVFGAPQSLVGRIQIGSPINVVFPQTGESAVEQSLASTITRIAPAADQSGRLFAIEASLPNESGTLRPGTIVSIRIPEAQSAPAMPVLPLGAIVRSPTSAGFAVFVVEGEERTGLVQARTVTLGDVVGNGVIVTAGVNAGDRVVTTGANLLTDQAEAVVIADGR